MSHTGMTVPGNNSMTGLGLGTLGQDPTATGAAAAASSSSMATSSTPLRVDTSADGLELELADVPEDSVFIPSPLRSTPAGSGTASASTTSPPIASPRPRPHPLSSSTSTPPAAASLGQPLSPRLRSPCASPRPASRARPTSALVSSLVAGNAAGIVKPRSNSSLHSSRPAPPSPATSRPQSQVLSSPGLSPHLSPRASPGPLGGLGIVNLGTPVSSSASSGPSPSYLPRDRASSVSSTRRLRPKSTLGTSSLVAPSLPEQTSALSEPTSPRRADSDDATPAAEGTPRTRGASISVAAIARSSARSSSASLSAVAVQVAAAPALSPLVSSGASASGVSAASASASGDDDIAMGSQELAPPPTSTATSTTASTPHAPQERAVPDQPQPGEEADAPPPAPARSSQLSDAGIVGVAATLVRRVVVRDYAYPLGDARFLGLGPHRSRSNWCEGEPEPEEPPEPEKPAWGMSSLGLGSWGFLSRRQAEPEPPVGAPAADDTDFRLEGTTPDHDNDQYWSDDDDDDDDEYEAGADDDPDGLFRAAYAFEPEGVNEMAVEVGDLLDVRGRGGGGDGWVVAIRLDSGHEGLVPEGYLEKVDHEECPEGWAHLTTMRREASEAPDGPDDIVPSDSPADISGANDSSDDDEDPRRRARA